MKLPTSQPMNSMYQGYAQELCQQKYSRYIERLRVWIEKFINRHDLFPNKLRVTLIVSVMEEKKDE